MAASADGGRGGILVTGAAGFIGSHVCEALLARGERVIGVDNFDPFYPAELKRRNVHEIEATAARLGNGGAGGTGGRGGWSFVEADIREPAQMARVFGEQRPAGVIHLAAKAGPRPSVKDPVGYALTNVVGTAAVLEAAASHGCERLVVASSSSVYGNNAKVPFAETDDVSGPVSPYAASKRACELFCHAHWQNTKIPTACLRFFTVFGPRQRPDLGISLFLRCCAGGETIRMFGDGTMSRDCTYIDDIVRGVLASYDRVDAHGYRVWNLGGNSPVMLRDMIATAARVVGREPVIERLPMQVGDVQQTYADLTRSAAELGFAVTVRLEEGMRRQWEWMRAGGAGAGATGAAKGR